MSAPAPEEELTIYGFCRGDGPCLGVYGQHKLVGYLIRRRRRGRRRKREHELRRK